MHFYGLCVMKLSNGVTTCTTSVKAVRTRFCVCYLNYFTTNIFLNHTFVMYSAAASSN